MRGCDDGQAGLKNLPDLGATIPNGKHLPDAGSCVNGVGKKVMEDLFAREFRGLQTARSCCMDICRTI